MSVLTSVLSEAINYIHERAADEAARETLDAVLREANLDVVLDDRTDFENGRTVFGLYDPLTDSVIVASLDRNGYVYSFDDDFDVVDGVTRLDTPVDPLV
ncbi:MAG: hypothetical protein ABEI75_02665 [Halobaculum sp.]